MVPFATLWPVFGQSQITNLACPNIPPVGIPLREHDEKTTIAEALHSVDISAFGRSRPAADAAREVVECWLLYGCDVSVGHRRFPYDPFAKNDVGRTPTS